MGTPQGLLQIFNIHCLYTNRNGCGRGAVGKGRIEEGEGGGWQKGRRIEEGGYVRLGGERKGKASGV